MFLILEYIWFAFSFLLEFAALKKYLREPEIITHYEL